MDARSRGLMIAVGLGIMLNPLNSAMISVAIARLQDVYSIDYTAVSWIVFAFYISSAVAQPVMGKASDLFGRRRIFLAGLVVSLFSSVLAPFSPNFAWLIVSRIVQSIGTSMLIAVGIAIVRIHITERQAAALAWLSIMLSGVSAIAPFAGGVLLGWWDWPAIFIVNIPFIVASFVLSWRMIPRDGPAASVASGMTFRKWLQVIDMSGIMLFTVGLVALLFNVLSAKSFGHVSIWDVVGVLIGFLALGTFVRHELKTASPFIPLRTFVQYPAMTWVNLQYMLVNLLYYALFFGVPSYMQMVRHVSGLQTGMVMLTLGLSSIVASPIAGRWVDKSGPGPALIVSAFLMVLGSVWIVTWTQTSPVFMVSLVLAVFGFSNGLNAVGMQAALFRSSPKEMAGVASGLFSTSRYFGTILSSLLTGIIMGDAFNFAGFRLLGVFLTVLALLLLGMSLRFRYSGKLNVSSTGM